MSVGWSSGSTRRWRRLRADVLASAGYRCKVHPTHCNAASAKPHTCLQRAPLHDDEGVPAGHAHHLDGKKNGDDPTRIRAACSACNLAIGDPGEGDPAPMPRTTW